MYLGESRQMMIGQVSIYLYMNESSFISPPYLEVCEIVIDITKDMHNPCQGKLYARPII